MGYALSMEVTLFGGRHDSKICGVISCFDRVMIKGTLPTACHTKALEGSLWLKNVLFKDYPNYALGLRDEIRTHIESLSKRENVPVHHLRSPKIRKEDFVQKKIAQQPEKTGVVCILSAMEKCVAFGVEKNKTTGYLGLRYETRQCLHYYIYRNDPELGLSFIAMPTWAPFTMRVYFNGHNWLARQMDKAGIKYEMDDNCFTHIDDYQAAQKLSDNLDVKELLHPRLRHWANEFCPAAVREFGEYHYSLHEVEYATDLVFDSEESLAPIYREIVHTAVCEIKHGDVATYLGRSLKNSTLEAGASLNGRMEGTSVRHRLGPASIKMYDKKGKVLRVETVLNDVSFLKTYREVIHQDGSSSLKNAPVKKSIYSLGDLRRLMTRANQRYLTHIGGLEERSVETTVLEKLTSPVSDGNTKRTVSGMSFFSGDDKLLFHSLLDGEYRLNGITNRNLRNKQLAGWSSGKVSRALKRLRLHGLIKKVANTYKYHTTNLCERILAPLLKFKTRILIPAISA